MTRLYTVLLLAVCISSLTIGAHSRGFDDSLNERKARGYFITGISLQQQGRHAEAILEFQESLAFDSSAVTMVGVAKSYIELRKYERALQFAKQATLTDRSLTEGWEVLAEVLVSTGSYDEAVDAYETLRTMSPTARQLYTLGRLYEPRNASKAIEIFEQLSLQRSEPIVLQHLADLYLRTRDTLARIRTVMRAMELLPDDVDVASDLIQMLIASQNIPRALALLAEWVDKPCTPEERERVWSVGLLQMLTDTAAISEHHDAVIELIKNVDGSLRRSWRIQAMSGALALRLHERPLADARFAKALELGQNVADAAIQVAISYSSIEDYRTSLNVLSRFAPSFPRDPRYAYFMGIACIQLDMDSAAIVLFKRTLDIDQSFVDAWVQLAIVYDGMNHPDSAEFAYASALRLDPDNHLVNNNYAYVLAMQDHDLDVARSLAWRALQHFPTNAAYLDTYAWILHRLGDNIQARSFIEQAVQRGGNATHYEHLGDILEALGLLDEAIVAWQRAIQLDPSRESARSKVYKFR